jgi:hypothetical protein
MFVHIEPLLDVHAPSLRDPKHATTRLTRGEAAKAKARGYRSTRNLKAIIYLIAGKLELSLPT